MQAGPCRSGYFVSLSARAIEINTLKNKNFKEEEGREMAEGDRGEGLVPNGCSITAFSQSVSPTSQPLEVAVSPVMETGAANVSHEKRKESTFL